MKYKIILNDQEIIYSFQKYKCSKSVKILINSGGELKLTAPTYVSRKKAADFLVKKKTWILEQIQKQKNNPNHLNAPGFHNYKFRAKRFVMNKVEEINHVYNLDFNSIKIKNNSRSWGSCSADRNLNFNYRLLFIPEHLVDYVVAHELCHLRELNHSPNFWKLVELAIPDYKIRRQELKKIIF